MYNFIIVILILIIIYLIFFRNNNENFEKINNDNVVLNTDPNPKYSDLKNQMEVIEKSANKTLNDGEKSYYQTVASDLKDVKYFYNDVINQTNINENSNDVINQIDKIDYSNVKTGIQKCKENCEGVCFELGYTGTASCFPKQTTPFDWGTYYKNPMFTYGYNAYNNPDKNYNMD